MLRSAPFGFMIGEAFGDRIRHRRYLEQASKDLRDALEKARAGEQPLLQELKPQRGLLNDIHSSLLPVSKGSEKPTG